MRAFVITLKDNTYSEKKASECIASAAGFETAVERFYGVDKLHAEQVMNDHDLTWKWAKNNTESVICPISGLKQFPYNAADLRAKIGCSMSHYLLWKKCIELDEPILILEHDAVFLRELPDFEFKGICQINDPSGATRKGHWWSQQMIARGGFGAFEKTWVTSESERMIPDGLAGNSAYVIRPWAAKELVNTFYKYGVWPNDATMCKQLFPYLEEYYPFITNVNQTQSTTVN